jgi:hypothetical protein
MVKCQKFLKVKSKTMKKLTLTLVSLILFNFISVAQFKLKPGEELKLGSKLTSQDGRYIFIMQKDGNLVLYKGKKALWSSKTFKKVVTKCIMQTDGNLVIYGTQNIPLWSSKTHGNKGAGLILQNDGNVVIYNTYKKAVWSTNTYERN